jgi:isocitrate/isopropylmalate dehydrogenase
MREFLPHSTTQEHDFLEVYTEKRPPSTSFQKSSCYFQLEVIKPPTQLQKERERKKETHSTNPPTPLGHRILFGAVGDPHIPDHISLWGLLLALRGPLQLYANVRPVRTFLGTTSYLRAVPTIDWLLVRENSEGEYAGHGGRSHVPQPWEAATEVAIFTRVGVERIMRIAFTAAKARPRKHLIVVTKSNSMRNGMVLWDEVVLQVSREEAFRDEVTWEKMLVDAMTVRMVTNPASIDTAVGTNLHVDILSDLAAALAGSIGVAPSANLDPERKAPNIFEPVHGSAFDIMGKGVANPVAAFWSAAEMLRWLGEDEAAAQLMGAVERVCERGVLTRDLGGSENTQGVTDAGCREIGKLTRGVGLTREG